jgi:hypothetical protein
VILIFYLLFLVFNVNPYRIKIVKKPVKHKKNQIKEKKEHKKYQNILVILNFLRLFYFYFLDYYSALYFG